MRDRTVPDISRSGTNVTFTVLTAIQAGGAGPLGVQYKTRQMAFVGGVLTVGAESGWNDI